MADETEQPDPTDVPDERLPETFKEMLSGPAYFSNKISVSNLNLGMRITFLEAAEGGIEHYRTAVFLTWPDVMALHDLLTKQLARVNVEVRQVDEAEAPADDGAGK